MEIEVVLADGSTKRVKSRSTYLWCSGCEGVPEEMWEWSYFNHWPFYDYPSTNVGDADSKPRDIPSGGVGQPSEGLIGYLDRFLDYADSLAALEGIVPCAVPGSVLQSTEKVRLVEQPARSSLQQVQMRRLKRRDMAVLDFFKASQEALDQALDSFYDAEHDIDLSSVPPESVGICKTHKTLVLQTSTTLTTTVSTDGLLRIMDGEVVVFGAIPGQWTTFYEVPEEAQTDLG